MVNSNWKKVMLKDIASTDKNSIVDGPFGSNLKTSDYIDDPQVPVLQGKNITNNKFEWKEIRYISFEKAKELERSSVREGDLLLTKIGTVGCVAILDDLKGFEFAIIPANLMKITLDKTKADTKFVYYNLLANEKRIKELASQTAQPALSLKTMKNFKIDLPPLAEQQKIAAILSSVDEAIEKTEAIIEQTEKVKKGLMQQLLTKGISHTRFKKTEIGEIPEEWEVCKIPDVLSNEKGSIKMGPFGSQIKKEDLTSSGVHIIGIENVLNKEYVHLGNRYISFEKFESLKTNQVLPGDVVITTMGTIGLADVIPEHIPTTIIDSHLIRLRVNKEKILNTYLAMIIQDYDLVKKQIKRMSQGGIMAGLNTSIIKSLSIPLPSLNEQRKIVNSLSSIDSKVQVETEKLIKLREIKKGLMQVLLTGKVRVKVDDEVVSS